jgi:hypothetical protein
MRPTFNPARKPPIASDDFHNEQAFGRTVKSPNYFDLEQNWLIAGEL